MKERRTKWDDFPDIMTTADIQEIFNLSKESVLKMIHQDGFPKLRLQGGRKYIFIKSAVQEFLHKQAMGELAVR